MRDFRGVCVCVFEKIYGGGSCHDYKTSFQSKEEGFSATRDISTGLYLAHSQIDAFLICFPFGHYFLKGLVPQPVAVLGFASWTN